MNTYHRTLTKEEISSNYKRLLAQRLRIKEADIPTKPWWEVIHNFSFWHASLQYENRSRAHKFYLKRNILRSIEENLEED